MDVLTHWPEIAQAMEDTFAGDEVVAEWAESVRVLGAEVERLSRHHAGVVDPWEVLRQIAATEAETRRGVPWVHWAEQARRALKDGPSTSRGVVSHDAYERALRTLMQFGKRLMASESEDERLIGTRICEGARVVEEPPTPRYQRAVDEEDAR